MAINLVASNSTHPFIISWLYGLDGFSSSNLTKENLQLHSILVAPSPCCLANCHAVLSSTATHVLWLAGPHTEGSNGRSHSPAFRGTSCLVSPAFSVIFL